MEDQNAHISRGMRLLLFAGVLAVLAGAYLFIAGWREKESMPSSVEVVERRQATAEESAQLEQAVQAAREKELAEIRKKAAEEARMLGR